MEHGRGVLADRRRRPDPNKPNGVYAAMAGCADGPRSLLHSSAVLPAAAALPCHWPVASGCPNGTPSWAPRIAPGWRFHSLPYPKPYRQTLKASTAFLVRQNPDTPSTAPARSTESLPHKRRGCPQDRRLPVAVALVSGETSEAPRGRFGTLAGGRPRGLPDGPLDASLRAPARPRRPNFSVDRKSEIC